VIQRPVTAPGRGKAALSQKERKKEKFPSLRKKRSGEKEDFNSKKKIGTLGGGR